MKKMKPIPNFPGYFATIDGQIWSEPKRQNHKIGKFLKPALHRNRYFRVVLCKNKKNYNCLVHRLILEAFVSSCPPGMEGCHNNGICIDNNLSNLRWDTRSNNAQDAVKHGTHRSANQNGEKNSLSKLTEKEIKEIRKLYKSEKFIQQQLADKFNVSKSNISRIVRRDMWKHI